METVTPTPQPEHIDRLAIERREHLAQIERDKATGAGKATEMLREQSTKIVLPQIMRGAASNL